MTSTQFTPSVFKFEESTPIRVITKEDEPWFVVKDICDILGLTNPTKAISNLDDDERSNLLLGRQGNTNIINESGLYALVIRSNKPNARKFRKWITSEVLPAIRRTGRYMVSSDSAPVVSGPFSALRYQGVEVIPTDELRRRLGITRGQLSGWLNRYNPLVEGADMFQVHGVTDKLALAMIRAGFKVNPNVVAVTLYTRSGFAKAAARFAAGAVPEPDDRGPKLDIPRLDPEKPPVSYTFDASMLPKEPKDFLCYKTLMVLKKAGYDIDREIAELSAFQHMAVSAGVIIRSMLADVQKTLGYMFQNYNRISQRAECTVAGEQVNTKAKTILHPGKEA